MSGFHLDVETAIGYGGHTPLPTGSDAFLLPSQGGGLLSVDMAQNTQEWWTPSDGAHELGCIALHPSGRSLCVAESRLRATILVLACEDGNFARAAPAQRRLLQRVTDVAKLQIADMQYSRDGTRLVVLADAPGHNITIFAVDKATERLSLLHAQRDPSGHQFTRISVSPRSCDDFCTSGGGHIAFWRYDASGNDLVALDGRVTAPNLRVQCHEWALTPPGTVLAGTASGHVVSFDLANGMGAVVAEPLPAAAATAPAGIIAIRATRHHIVVASADGTLRFFAHAAGGNPAAHTNDNVVSRLIAVSGAAGQSAVQAPWGAPQRVFRLPGVTALRSFVVCPDFGTFLAGCGESGRLYRLSIEGYAAPSISAELFDDARFDLRLLMAGVREPLIGSTFVGPADQLAVVDTSGVMRLMNVEDHQELGRAHIGEDPTCLTGTQTALIVTGSGNGTIRVFDTTDRSSSGSGGSNALKLVLRDSVGEGQPIKQVLAHPSLPIAVAVAGRGRLVFLSVDEPPSVLGLAELPAHLDGTTSVSWTMDESPPTFLASTRNSGVTLIRFPMGAAAGVKADPATLVYPIEQLIVNSWRLELPMGVIAVGFSSETNIVVLGGCVDKETKYFNVDRTLAPERKDRESKPLKMPIAFRDHDKGLAAVRVVGGKFLVTAGTDGRIVVRDIAPLLSTTPALRDIRKDALASVTHHVSAAGGIRQISVHRSLRRLASAGADGTLLVWGFGAASASYMPRRLYTRAGGSNEAAIDEAPPARDAEEKEDFRAKRTRLAEENERRLAQGEHATTLREVARLRERLRELAAENSRLQADERAALEDFLVPADRMRFEQRREAAVEAMRQEVHVGDLRVEYECQRIQRTRWDAMTVHQTPIVAVGSEKEPAVARESAANAAVIAPGDGEITAADATATTTTSSGARPLRVSNFAVAAAPAQDATMLLKLKFLRRMQERDSYQRQVLSHRQQQRRIEAVARQHEQQVLLEAEQHEQRQHQRQPGLFNDAEVLNQQQQRRRELQQRGAAIDAERAALREPVVPHVIAASMFAAVVQRQSDVTPFLFKIREVFTRVRAVQQSRLLQAKALLLRARFNERFNELSSDKKTLIARAAERNAKCRIIQLYLADDAPLVQCHTSPTEQPERVLTVSDDEVRGADRSKDPAYLKKLATDEADKERWRRMHGGDDAYERALKAWMDGRLDKEIKPLEAKLDLPDFADERSSKFIPADERNDDQQKIFRDYEKKLQKLVEEVAAKRAQLQSELAQLQTQTKNEIRTFDASLKKLFTERIGVCQRVLETELTRVKVSQGVLLHDDRVAVLGKLEQQRITLADRLVIASAAAARFRQALEDKRAALAQLQADERAKERNLRAVAPFSESDELYRWYSAVLNKRKGRRGVGAAQQRAGGGDNLAGSLRLGATAGAASVAAELASISSGVAPSSHLLRRGPWGGNTLADPWAFIDAAAADAADEIADESTTAPAAAAAASPNGGALPPMNSAAARYPDRPESVPEAAWAEFHRYIDARTHAEREIKKLQESVQSMTAEDARLSAAESQLRALAERAEADRVQYAGEVVREQFDVDGLYVFRQGHVEVEQAPVVTDYGDAALIRADRVKALNADIRERGAAKVALMKDFAARQRELRQVEWEMEHAAYQTRTLELEYRHLHTLRVTKQMQEFISGGGEGHNEREREKLRRKIEHVRATMAERIEDKKAQMSKIRRQTREREMENAVLAEQVDHADALVGTRRHVLGLQGSETDAQLPQRLLRDMRVTRQLQDITVGQRTQLQSLTTEVDRLRERTFPSFAVVSKRVIGGTLPDDAPFAGTGTGNGRAPAPSHSAGGSRPAFSSSAPVNRNASTGRK